MKIISVIPARYGSTRFLGKPLALLCGKPIIQWVVEGARKSKLIHDLYVATDDARIADVCKKINVDVLMTSTECLTGTDRIFEATKKIDFDVVLNIQGDEPLISEEYIDPLITAFKNDNQLDMATLAHQINELDFENKNAVKVITNKNDEAIYFSRFAIPYSREQNFNSAAALKHIGLYGYSKSFLEKFCNTPQCEIEKAESLEQLRALYLGAKIKVLKVRTPIHGIDTPEDLKKVADLIDKGLV